MADVTIITGDARAELAKLPAESVHCCITSPPYYGLRDYGVVGQLGLEATPDEYVAAMVGVFREVRRVLRSDGTLWLNIGDSYAGAPSGSFDKGGRGSGPLQGGGFRANKAMDTGRLPGIKPKDLLGIPWMLAFALRADGWWLRQDIIWAKPNPMPESVTDRCTKAHEYLFLLSKSSRYFYDAEAIKEDAIVGYRTEPLGEPRTGRKAASSSMWRWVGTAAEGIERGGSQQQQTTDPSVPRNKRSVWTIATAPYSEAHFATFPPALIEPCIMAGCPKGGTVLDPFGGAGTTGLVADRLGRDAILIELNPTYAEMAKRRIERDAGLFARVAAD